MSSTDIERALAALSRNHELIAPNTAVRLIRDARTSARPLAELVREQVEETALLGAIAQELSVRFLDLNRADAGLITDERVISRCDTKFLTDRGCVPLVNREGQIVVAMANPLDHDAMNYLRGRFPEGFTSALTPRSQVQAKLLSLTTDFDVDFTPGPTAVVDWVEHILIKSVAERASDLHLRFLADGTLMIRMRIDSMLRPVRYPDALRGREAEVVGTMLARCPTIDSSNTREPQDGTFSFNAGGRVIDARVGMIPQVTGTNVTVRLLDSLTLRRRPEDMGINPEHLKLLREGISSPQGCIVVVGPTGSGKTTTLYSLLREVDAVSRNVLTVEDPVEYRLPYVGQTQIRSDLGERSVTWSRALRAIVRNDPDVILVGEVRDSDVARVAMEAAITGHLVLTTLHAHTAPGAYSRLIQMGVPSYLVADAVSMVLSQRLVRQVHECAVMEAPTPEEIAALARWGLRTPGRVAHPVGCSVCNGTGYRGRLAVAELLAASPRLRSLVALGAPTEEIRTEAERCGWRPITDDGLRHLAAGRTTVAELIRALSESDIVDGPDDEEVPETAAEEAARISEYVEEHLADLPPASPWSRPPSPGTEEAP